MSRQNLVDVVEHQRLNDAREAGTPWKKWGPHLSERQWGTVREDYSENGDAWNFFTHDHARSRAYRWGEDEHHSNPLHTGYRQSRNSEWFHMLNKDIISMPDKWEYPWYAAWDLAFHTLPLAIVDADFAKQQMELMVLNFTWWANRKDRFGKNVFEGGFLGLDNIGVFDRSAPLPTGGHLEQADGTAWMALFSQNMAELAIELAAHDSTYEEMVTKFGEQFYYIAAAMNRPGQDGMWDEEDGFYYDLLRFPDGSATRLKVRSMVGLLPW